MQDIPPLVPSRRLGMNKSQDIQGLHRLIISMGKGEENALSNLIERKQTSLVNIIRRYSSDFDQATIDAIFWQVLMNIWRNSPSYRGYASNETQADKVAWGWIVSIIRNQCHRVSAKMSRLNLRETSFDDLSPNPDSGDEFVDQPQEAYHPDDRYAQYAFSTLERIEFMQSVQELYTSLNPQQRKVFEMLANGMKQKAISQSLNLTEARVSQLVKEIKIKAKFLF